MSYQSFGAMTAAQMNQTYCPGGTWLPDKSVCACPPGTTFVTGDPGKGDPIAMVARCVPSYKPTTITPASAPAPIEVPPVAGSAGGIFGGDTLMWAAGGLLVATVGYVVWRRSKAS